MSSPQIDKAQTVQNNSKNESDRGASSAVSTKSKGNKPRRKQSRGRRGGQKSTQKTWDLSQFAVPVADDKTRFHDLDLPDELMHAIHDLGFEYCSPIQEKILPHTLQGLDAIGKAQTGTGKTAAFLLTIIDDLMKHPIEEQRYHGDPRALIIAPTRELVMQIASDAVGLCKYTNMHVVSLFGGMDYQKQHKQIQNKFVDIVVATPGRLIDFMTRKDIYLDMVECLVLDEADRMLDMGFIPQVKRIVRACPGTDFRQTQLYSATFNQDILNLISRWTYNPVTIEIAPEHVATDTVEQIIYLVSNDDKFRLLLNLLRSDEVKKTLIFTNRRDQTQRLYDKIHKQGFNVGLLSGEISQHKRTKTLANFKAGSLDVLVATDVMGRGIHVEDISHVINYNLPEDPDDYVHRIGRTGRAGATGIAISLACEFESFQLPAIEELLGEKLKCELPPAALLE